MAAAAAASGEQAGDALDDGTCDDDDVRRMNTKAPPDTFWIGRTGSQGEAPGMEAATSVKAPFWSGHGQNVYRQSRRDTLTGMMRLRGDLHWPSVASSCGPSVAAAVPLVKWSRDRHALAAEGAAVGAVVGAAEGDADLDTFGCGGKADREPSLRARNDSYSGKGRYKLRGTSYKLPPLCARNDPS